jgi:hypothetical protein
LHKGKITDLLGKGELDVQNKPGMRLLGYISPAASQSRLQDRLIEWGWGMLKKIYGLIWDYLFFIGLKLFARSKDIAVDSSAALIHQRALPHVLPRDSPHSLCRLESRGIFSGTHRLRH